MINVLHVDDDSEHLKVVRRYLRLIDPQIVVESLGSSHEALEMLPKREFDCLVSDYVMPEIDGITFAKKVRELSDVPFILYTGQGSEEVASAAFEAGIDDYLRKEFDRSHYQVLVKRIRTAVDKHRAEEALRLREEQYRKMVETSPDAITVTDLEGKLIASNRQAALIHGYNSEREMVEAGLNAFDFIAPEDRQRAFENAKKTMETGFIRNVEYNILRKDGTSFPAELNASVILGENGEPTAFLGIARDISKRKLYQIRLEVLHEHATKIKSALNIIEVATLTLDAVEQVLGFKLGNFSVVEGGLLREIHTRGLDLVEDYLLPLNGKGITVRAIRTGETQLVRNVKQDKDFVLGPVEGHYEPLSELAVPVKIDQRVVAIINIESEKLEAFDEDDKKIIEILADHVSSTLHNIQLLEAERSIKDKIEALHSSSAELDRAKSSEEIFDISMNIIQRVLGFRWGGIGVVTDRGLKYVRTIGAEIPSDLAMPVDGPGVTVRTVRTGKSQLIQDTRRDPNYVKLSETESGHIRNLSELSVPLFVGDQVKGIINLENEEPGAFSEDDARLLEILARHMGSALSRLQEIKALKESEKKFKGFLEASLDAVVVNVGTRIEYVNHKLIELLGYVAPSDLLGREITDLFPVELREYIRNRTLRRQMGENEPILYETHFLRRDGTTLEVEAVLSVIDYESQPATLAYARDITERKRFERKLDALHTHALKLAKAGSVEEIADSTIGAIERIFGFSYMGFAVVEDDFLKFKYIRGKSNTRELPLDGPGLTVRAIKSRKTQHVPDTRKNEFYLSSRFAGEPESLSELDVPIFVDHEPVALINIESEQVDAFSVNDRDLVEILSMHVSSAFRRLLEVRRLEALVEGKTRELLEAERAVAAGRIASMVGHDLRGPLQVIDGAVGVMRVSPSESEALLNTIETSVRRAAGMLDEIHSHIRDTPLETMKSDLVALVTKALDEMVFPESIHLSIEAQKESIPVEIDRMKIRRVLDNLVQNALDAMPSGGQLQVSLYEEDNWAVMAIEDTGEGIPEEILSKLFSLFVTTKKTGAGLGLPYCKRTIIAHGGSIEVDSEPGHGVTFTVRLPKANDAETETERQQIVQNNLSIIQK